jgi:hypothetical protein
MAEAITLSVPGETEGAFAQDQIDRLPNAVRRTKFGFALGCCRRRRLRSHPLNLNLGNASAGIGTTAKRIDAIRSSPAAPAACFPEMKSNLARFIEQT